MHRLHKFLGDYSALVRLWCLRALTAPAARVKHHAERLFLDDALIELLRVDREQVPEEPTEIREFFELQLCEAEAAGPSIDGLLYENLHLIGKQLELTPLDLEILALLVLARLEEPLRDALEAAGRLTDPRFDRLIAAVLHRPLHKVTEALSPSGRLAATHLVVPVSSVGTFEDKVRLKDELPYAFTRKNSSLEELIAFAAMRAAPPHLRRMDYEHLSQHLEILVPYLRQVIEERRKGVNVLLYGGAGNGKTQLAKVIAQDLALFLYEVRFADDDGDPASPAERIGSYTLMQAILCRQKRAMILFDEIEDILPKDFGFLGLDTRESAQKKAWVNRTLEENPVPAIWIGNDIAHIESAFLRRFDYVLELSPPPRSARERILRTYLRQVPVSEKWLARKADERGLTPGILAKLARVLEVDCTQDGETLESRFDLMARERLGPHGHVPVGARYPHPTRYRPELLNASVDPVAVATRLGARARGNVLLYGPPGAGKTGYAHFVARQLDRTLLVKRASELLSMWLGGTEKLISELFAQATSDGAMLLLDEADSFLQDRRWAQRSWEVTQVNELLTQMEAFEGIFICATNFFEHLDSAAMRRFALKVRFEPLRPDQKRLAFGDALAELGIPAADEMETRRVWRELDALPGLTPGDFLAARSAIDLGAYSNTQAGLIQALRTELLSRPDAAKRPIGFAA